VAASGKHADLLKKSREYRELNSSNQGVIVYEENAPRTPANAPSLGGTSAREQIDENHEKSARTQTNAPQSIVPTGESPANAQRSEVPS